MQMQGATYSAKADVFSFAIIIWEMLSEQLPYEGQTLHEDHKYSTQLKCIQLKAPYVWFYKLLEITRQLVHICSCRRCAPKYFDTLESSYVYGVFGMNLPTKIVSLQ